MRPIQIFLVYEHILHAVRLTMAKNGTDRYKGSMNLSKKCLIEKIFDRVKYQPNLY
jgi:hypothetical protein